MRELTQVVALNNELGRLTRGTVRQQVLLFSIQFTETSVYKVYTELPLNVHPIAGKGRARRRGPLMFHHDTLIFARRFAVSVSGRTNVPLTISNLHGSIGRACNYPIIGLKIRRIIAQYLCNRFHNPQLARRSERFPTKNY